MADDITLTVRVRDMTRGDFNQIRQRMRGMGGDVRRLARTADDATDSSDRFANSLTGLQRRLSQFQRTGRLARHEMDFMRRSMGLLGRDLRSAAADGELTEDQFRDLRRELERTRLDFDHLDNALRRQDAMAQRRARNAADRQREAERQRREAMRAAAQQQREAERRAREERRRQEADARAIVALRRRMSQAHAAALREEAARNAAALREADRLAREERRRQEALARSIITERQRIARAHAAALREEAARNRRAEAERQRAARAAAAAQRQQVGRLAGLGGDDQDLALRFRALGTRDMDRMARSFVNLQRAMAGISGGSAQAQRSVRQLGGDLRTMAQALRQAQDEGTLSRREFDALSNGLRMTVRDARLLRSSGDLTRSAFRDMRREVAGLRAQLRLLGNEGNVFNRLGDSVLLLQRRLRDTREHAGVVQRTLSRLGEGGLGGVRLFTRGLGQMAAGVGRFREFISGTSRAMRMFMLVLALLGPLAPAIGALLTSALGGAFIALGAFALRAEKDVKAAFTHMKSTVGVTVRAAAQPLRAGLVVAMNEVTEATQEMGNALTEAFSASSFLVSDLAGAFTDLASGALPGIVESLREMGPVMEGFRSAFGSIGEGLGQMFAAMTSEGGAEGLRETWGILGEGIQGVLVDIGEFINAMSQSETATTLLATAFNALSSILVIIEGIFAAVDLILGPLIKKMGELGLTTGLLGGLAWALEQIGVSSVETDAAAGGLAEKLKGTAEAQNEAAVKTLSHADALKQLNEQIKTYNSENLNRFEAEASMNQALQDAMRNSENLGNTVKINNGVFETAHENTRKVAQDFYKLAESTQRAVDAAIEAEQPLSEQNRLWKEGEANIRSLGKAYGIPKAELDAFIALVMKTPTTRKMELQLEAEAAKQKAADLISKMNQADGFQAKMKAALEAGAAVRDAGQMVALLNALDGRTTRSRHIHTRIMTEVMNKVDSSASRPFGARGGLASALPSKRFATGGSISGDVLQGPGTDTSDSLLARLSRGEFVMRASAVRRFGVPFMKAINAGGALPGFAKGGLSDDAKQARRDLSGMLGISRFGRRAGYQFTGMEKQLGRPQDMSALVSSLNSLSGTIKKAFSGRTENRLLRQLDKAATSLIKYEKKLADVNKRLDAAKDKLTELRNSAKQMRESVASGVVSATNITSGISGDKATTVASLMSRMTRGRDRATSFAQALKELQKRGVNKETIRQIAEAGIEGGGLETAGALLRASGSEIQSINDLQKQIGDAAKSAGATAADAMFGAGIKAAEGLVKGLEKQKKNIEKAMMAIAKSMEKAIKRALGIKSPSKVMEQVGHFTAEGFAVGMEKNTSTAAAWSSMLNVPQVSGGSAGGGGRGEVYHLNLVVDGKVWEEVWIDTGRRAVRTRGGKVETLLNSRK